MAPDTFLYTTDGGGVYVSVSGTTPEYGHAQTDYAAAVGRDLDASGFQVIMADGSVQFLVYDISLETFRRLGNRHDGDPVILDDL